MHVRSCMHIPFCIYNYYKCIIHLIIYLYMCMYMLRLGFAMLPPDFAPEKTSLQRPHVRPEGDGFVPESEISVILRLAVPWE